jgi:hypothetical protein
MPKPRPLSPAEARATLAHRFSGRADRLRQFATKFGIRPVRVFLVWEKWTGEEAGEGVAKTLGELELLPTPKIDTAQSLNFRAGPGGAMPDGTVRLTGISGLYTKDQLQGVAVPDAKFIAENNPPKAGSALALPRHKVHLPEGYSFFYELREDGRGDNPPAREKYELADVPERDAGNVQWVVTLQRVSEDRSRSGQNQIGPDIDE